jgi:vacuolar-type H+-ATPase subunit I/STV1
MLKTERSVFAPAIVDGALRQDVAQTTVSFDKHKLLAPAAELIDCRRQVGVLILRRMAGLALERITALGERAVELEQRKAMLGSRLRMLSLRRNGLEEVAAGDASAELAKLQEALKATADDYQEAKASLATLDSRMAQINAVFNAPAEHVNIARTQVRVNRMGYKVEERSGEPVVPITLTELSIGSGLTVVIAFVRCPRAELPPKEDLVARAARELM